MKKNDVSARILEVGIVASVRVASTEDARFAAESIFRGGIPVVEITMTIPGALDLISQLLQAFPKMIVGAGSVWDTASAQSCVSAGARFLTSDGLSLPVVEFAVNHGVVVFPGALTPTEVATAWKAGSDFVKVIPCAQVGGDTYIRALKMAFPEIPMIAAGGVNQQTALSYLLARASALGIGGELVPGDAIHLRQTDRIAELSRRFLEFVKEARTRLHVRRDVRERK
ncbi:MAG TPA: bifunctional 4-hydroxy-2-oxoglutarate aldolase/2-dehydro-3-deoxy-phosphogluconate aldolase [Verrucomicrobiae bacterium]|nr:bifunctional 4-hydroxy-2-oxoglutarate aldolase/2-dehydro-3-deoxy-phosphogluconate aldolase [Verrucomicrobiae bacterium]